MNTRDVCRSKHNRTRQDVQHQAIYGFKNTYVNKRIIDSD